ADLAAFELVPVVVYLVRRDANLPVDDDTGYEHDHRENDYNRYLRAKRPRHVYLLHPSGRALSLRRSINGLSVWCKVSHHALHRGRQVQSTTVVDSCRAGTTAARSQSLCVLQSKRLSTPKLS